MKRLHRNSVEMKYLSGLLSSPASGAMIQVVNDQKRLSKSYHVNQTSFDFCSVPLPLEVWISELSMIEDHQLVTSKSRKRSKSKILIDHIKCYQKKIFPGFIISDHEDLLPETIIRLNQEVTLFLEGLLHHKQQVSSQQLSHQISFSDSLQESENSSSFNDLSIHDSVHFCVRNRPRLNTISEEDIGLNKKSSSPHKQSPSQHGIVHGNYEFMENLMIPQQKQTYDFPLQLRSQIPHQQQTSLSYKAPISQQFEVITRRVTDIEDIGLSGVIPKVSVSARFKPQNSTCDEDMFGYLNARSHVMNFSENNSQPIPEGTGSANAQTGIMYFSNSTTFTSATNERVLENEKATNKRLMEEQGEYIDRQFRLGSNFSSIRQEKIVSSAPVYYIHDQIDNFNQSSQQQAQQIVKQELNWTAGLANQGCSFIEKQNFIHRMIEDSIEEEQENCISGNPQDEDNKEFVFSQQTSQINNNSFLEQYDLYCDVPKSNTDYFSIHQSQNGLAKKGNTVSESNHHVLQSQKNIIKRNDFSEQQTQTTLTSQSATLNNIGQFIATPNGTCPHFNVGEQMQAIYNVEHQQIGYNTELFMNQQQFPRASNTKELYQQDRIQIGQGYNDRGHYNYRYQ